MSLQPIPPVQLLDKGLAIAPDRLALVSAETRWTWQQLNEASSRLAANLLGLGLEPGDRVASLMPNRAALVVHYIACLKAGLVATPLNYRYQPPEIDHALALSEASILFAHAERDDDLAACQFASQLPLGRISFAGDATGPSFEELVEKPSTKQLPPPNPNSPAFIFFTSGSTGRPKGVTHTHETLGWMMTSCNAAFEVAPDDIVLPGSSISHIGGVLMSLSALGFGVRVLVARTFDGDELLPLLRDDRPTVLSMLPAALFSLVRDHNARHDDFRSLRLCIAGGDKVSAELEREFTDLAGFPIDEGYGMTEIGFTTLSPPSGVNKLGSVGRLLPTYEGSLRDDSGREVAKR